MISLQGEAACSAHCHSVGSSRDRVQPAGLLVDVYPSFSPVTDESVLMLQVIMLHPQIFLQKTLRATAPFTLINRPGVAGAVL